MRVRDFLADAIRSYYAKGPRIGAEGDFYTASNVSLFPHAIGRFVDAAVERLGGARVVELGGGTGSLSARLARDVVIVEPSPGLAEAQRAKGLRVVASLDDLPPAPTVFLANEVLDALPVHRIVRTGEGMRECYLVDGREAPGPLSEPALEEAAARLAPHLLVGAKAEVCLDALPLFDAMRCAAPRSYALFLDYGGEPATLYGERTQGTLRGYRAHRVTDPFAAPGEQDVTSDVDWPWIEALARRAGFDVVGPRGQGAILGDLGLVDDMMGALQRGDTDAYMAAKGLLLPGGMGERFQGMLLGRDAPLDPPLPGFREARA